MSDGIVHERLTQTLTEVGLAPEALEELASQLLWRIGRASEEGPVTVRVGLASSAEQFQALPRLRSATDAEIESAVREGSLRLEWVGPRLRAPER
ncbi:MAG: DUF3248 domain-containing protein [Deinococcales bacterium]|nr:DUF3248 domain-containing protein [Deinococcales bacterium]